MTRQGRGQSGRSGAGGRLSEPPFVDDLASMAEKTAVPRQPTLMRRSLDTVACERCPWGAIRSAITTRTTHTARASVAFTTAFIHAASHLSDEALRSKSQGTAHCVLHTHHGRCWVRFRRPSRLPLAIRGCGHSGLVRRRCHHAFNGPGLAAAPGAQDETASSMSTEAIEMAHTVSAAEPDLPHSLANKSSSTGVVTRPVRHMLSSVTKPGVSRAVYDGGSAHGQPASPHALSPWTRLSFYRPFWQQVRRYVRSCPYASFQRHTTRALPAYYWKRQAESHRDRATRYPCPASHSNIRCACVYSAQGISTGSACTRPLMAGCGRAVPAQETHTST